MVSAATGNWAWTWMNNVLAYVSYMYNKLAFMIFSHGEKSDSFWKSSSAEKKKLTFQSTNIPFNLQER